MRKVFFFFATLLGGFTAASAGDNGTPDAIAPADAHARVTAGEAVLIDVREPEEWTDGVAEGALLLPLSDLKSTRTQWKATLSTAKEKELILYCRSGRRAAAAGELLAKEGFKVTNAGGFTDWEKAGLPVRKPKEK